MNKGLRANTNASIRVRDLFRALTWYSRLLPQVSAKGSVGTPALTYPMHAHTGLSSPRFTMSLSTMRRINIDHALHSPSKEQLTTLLSTLCSDGRLWKLGSCFESQLDTRPFSTQHYNPTWFDTEDAMCVAYAITTKELAAALETASIRHLKHTLLVGVNVKDQDDVPHDAISAAASSFVVMPYATHIAPLVSNHVGL